MIFYQSMNQAIQFINQMLKNLDQLIQLRKERMQASNIQTLEKKLYDQTILLQSVVTENNMLKEKISYLEDKMKQIIQQAIQIKMDK